MPGLRIGEDEFNRLLREGHAIISSTVDNNTPTPTATELDKVIRSSQRQRLENKFLELWQRVGGQEGWVRNYKFDLPDSKMELDFAWPELKVAVEINGGQAQGGNSGHGNWGGLERDALKQNQCVRKGWKLFWLPTSLVNHAEVTKIANDIDSISKGST